MLLLQGYFVVSALEMALQCSHNKDVLHAKAPFSTFTCSTLDNEQGVVC